MLQYTIQDLQIKRPHVAVLSCESVKGEALNTVFSDSSLAVAGRGIALVVLRACKAAMCH